MRGGGGGCGLFHGRLAASTARRGPPAANGCPADKRASASIGGCRSASAQCARGRAVRAPLRHRGRATLRGGPPHRPLAIQPAGVGGAAAHNALSYGRSAPGFVSTRGKGAVTPPAGGVTATPTPTRLPTGRR